MHKSNVPCNFTRARSCRLFLHKAMSSTPPGVKNQNLHVSNYCSSCFQLSSRNSHRSQLFPISFFQGNLISFGYFILCWTIILNFSLQRRCHDSSSDNSGWLKTEGREIEVKEFTWFCESRGLRGSCGFLCLLRWFVSLKFKNPQIDIS